MIILSVAFHGLLFILVSVSSFAWQRRDVMPVVQPVDLVSLPRGELKQPEPEPLAPPKPAPPKAKEPPKVEAKPKAPEKVPVPAEPPAPAKPKEPVPDEKAPRQRIGTAPVDETAAQPEKVEPPDRQEASLPSLGVPDVLPVLQKPYSEYEFYHALIGRVIRKRWAPPPFSLDGERMETVVAFSLSRSGRIEGSVMIEKSSGNLFYDQAAMRATLGPLPPPPPGYPEELLRMRLIYVLDQSRPN